MTFEIIFYLIVVFSVLVLAVTWFEKDVYIKDKYLLTKSDDILVKVTVEVKGLSKEEIKDIYNIFKNGKYENIYDISNEFEVLEMK